MASGSDVMDISDDDAPTSGVALQKPKTKSRDEPSNNHSNDPSDDNSGDDSDEDGVVFEVETILAQRKVSGSLEYLVKWDGYDLMNATWEPKNSFDSEDTLRDWQEKKLQINYGKLPSFNVGKWEREKSRLEDEFSAAGKDMEENNSELHTNMDDYFFPLLTPEPDPPRRPRHRLSAASDTSSSLFVTPEPSSSKNQALPTLPTSSLGQPPLSSYPSIEDDDSPVAETTAHEPSLDTINREQNPFKLPFPPRGPSGRRFSGASDASSSLFVTPEPTSSKNKILPTRSLSSTGQASVASKPPIRDPKWPDATSQEKRKQPTGNQASRPQPTNQKAGSTTKHSTQTPSVQKATVQKATVQKPNTQNPVPPKPPVVVPTRVKFGQPARPKFTRKRGYESSWGRERVPDPDQIQLMKPSEYSKRENYGHATPNLPGSKIPGASAQSSVGNPETTGAADHVSTPGVPHASGPFELLNSDPFTGQPQQLPWGDAISTELDTSMLPVSTDRYNSRSTGRSSHLAGFNRRPSSPDGDNRHGGHSTRRRSPGVYSRRFSETGNASTVVSSPPVLSEQEQIASMPVGRPQEGANEWPNGCFSNPGEVFAHVYFGDLKTYIGPMRLVGELGRARNELLTSGVTVGSSLELWFKELYTVKEHTELVNKGSLSRICHNAWMEGFESSNERLFRMAEYLRKERMAAVYRPANCFASNWVAYSPETSFASLLAKGNQDQFPKNVPIRLAIRETLPPLSVLPGTRGPRPPSDEFLYGKASQAVPVGPKKLPEKTRKSFTSNDLPYHPDMDMDQSSPFDPQSVSDSITNPSDIALRPRMLSDMFSSAAQNTDTRLLGELESNFPTGPNQRPFYLHFPSGDDDVGEDFEFMSTWLGCYNIQFLTNRVDQGTENNKGWINFFNTHKSGVVIFHESFCDFAAMRPTIRHALRNPDIDFWHIRLKRPLDFPDLRYAKEGCHIQRLFPHGSAILVTEDVCQDMKELAMIVFWFYKKCTGRRKGLELNKLVFWPDILGYLDKRLEDPARKKEDDPFILSIIAYIKHINSGMDSASSHFEISSLDIQNFENPNSNIVCLPLKDYGRRQEKDHPHLPKGLTQSERDADHLVEAFSGWTLLNAACLRKTMVLSNHKNERLLHHWASRGHVSLYECKGFFESLKLGDEFKAGVLQALQNGQKRDGESPITPGDRSATTPRAPPTPKTPQEPLNRDSREHARSSGDPRAAQASRWTAPAPHGRHSIGRQ